MALLESVVKSTAQLVGEETRTGGREAAISGRAGEGGRGEGGGGDEQQGRERRSSLFQVSLDSNAAL